MKFQCPACKAIFDRPTGFDKDVRVCLNTGHVVDEKEIINWPVTLTKRQWDLINIALIKISEIKNLPLSPFRDDWDYLYNLSKERGSCK